MFIPCVCRLASFLLFLPLPHCIRVSDRQQTVCQLPLLWFAPLSLTLSLLKPETLPHSTSQVRFTFNGEYNIWRSPKGCNRLRWHDTNGDCLFSMTRDHATVIFPTRSDLNVRRFYFFVYILQFFFSLSFRIYLRQENTNQFIHNTKNFISTSLFLNNNNNNNNTKDKIYASKDGRC